MNEAEAVLVAALRSGKYAQTQKRLRQGTGFCCLGVACDVLGNGRWVNNFTSAEWEYVDSYSSDRQLGCDVRLRLEWTNRLGRLTDQVRDRDGERQYLSGLNDDGFTFDQIADIVEAGLVERRADG